MKESWHEYLDPAPSAARALVPLMVLALLVGACSGGSGGPDDLAAPEPTVAEDTDDADGDDGGASIVPAQTDEPSAFGEFTAKRRDATFKVTYEWTSGSNPLPNETWYQKPPRSRIDFGSGTDQWMAQFILENGLFICQRTNGKADCWEAPQGDAKIAEELSFAAAIMYGYEDLLSDSSFAAERAERTIAGQPASCATARNVVILGFAEITVCHSGSGVPLLLEWKIDDETLRMEATSYTTAVSDADLELLAAPQDPAAVAPEPASPTPEATIPATAEPTAAPTPAQTQTVALAAPTPAPAPTVAPATRTQTPTRAPATPPPAFSISGRIVSAVDGRPLPNAGVVATINYMDWVATADARPDGTYTLVFDNAGKYRLRFFNPDDNGLVEAWFWGDTQRDVDAPQVVVSGPVSGVDIAFPKAGYFRGTVTDPSGAPVVDGLVNAYESDDHGYVGTAFTDELGRYVLRLLPGTYYLMFFRTLEAQFEDEGIYWNGQQALTLSSELQIDFAFP